MILWQWVISIGCWTYIITLLSLHLYEYTYCKYLVQSHVRDRVRVWAGVGQWLNRWGWCTEMEHSSAPVVVAYQRGHRALFAATRRVLSPPGVEGVSLTSSATRVLSPHGVEGVSPSSSAQVHSQDHDGDKDTKVPFFIFNRLNIHIATSWLTTTHHTTETVFSSQELHAPGEH